MAIRISGLTSGLDTESLVRDLTSAYSAKKDQFIKSKKLLEVKQDVWKDVNKDIYSFYTGSLSTARFQGNYKKSNLTSSNEKVVGDIVGKSGVAAIQVKQLASKSYMTSAPIKDEDWPLGQSASLIVKIGGQEQEVKITGDMKIKEVAAALSDVGLEANFDERHGRLFLSSKMAGAASKFSIEGDEEAIAALGLGEGAAVKEGTDAIVEVNGATFTQDNNKFDINGLSFEAKSVGSANISTTSSSSVKDIIKDFVENYNNLIKNLETRYNAASIKGYQPLTEDEEEAMTDKQIEKWNDKINEGVLRKDESLGGVISALKQGMMGSVKIGDKDYSLASMGITTNGYFTKDAAERNVYNIDEDKLDAFIEKMGEDDTVKVFSGVATNVYDKLGDRMKSTSMRSAYNVYNDKQIKKDIDGWEKKISKWEDKIGVIEDRYYKQFAAMEKMMAKMQGDSSALNGWFG